MEIYSYKTLAKPSKEVLYKDRKSKFFGYALPVLSEADIKTHLEAIQQKHSSANHVCFAWQLGIESPRYRANDDGEPNNSAGMPIYGQIQAFGVTNVLVAVARIFGGTKLGVGGLIQAYREAAKLAFENSEIIAKEIEVQFKIQFEYSNLNSVMSILKRYNANILDQEMKLDCLITSTIPKKTSENFEREFDKFQNVVAKKAL